MPPIRTAPVRKPESDRSAEYIEFKNGKIYLKISDIARDPARPSVINSSLFSWLFPPNDCGAKIPHSSIIAFENEYEFTEDGIIKRPSPRLTTDQVQSFNYSVV